MTRSILAGLEGGVSRGGKGGTTTGLATGDERFVVGAIGGRLEVSMLIDMMVCIALVWSIG